MLVEERELIERRPAVAPPRQYLDVRVALAKPLLEAVAPDLLVGEARAPDELIAEHGDTVGARRPRLRAHEVREAEGMLFREPVTAETQLAVALPDLREGIGGVAPGHHLLCEPQGREQ